MTAYTDSWLVERVCRQDLNTPAAQRRKMAAHVPLEFSQHLCPSEGSGDTSFTFIHSLWIYSQWEGVSGVGGGGWFPTGTFQTTHGAVTLISHLQLIKPASPSGPCVWTQGATVSEVCVLYRPERIHRNLEQDLSEMKYCLWMCGKQGLMFTEFHRLHHSLLNW